MIDIILIGIEHPGNLGAVARAMKNFGFSNLILVDPKCKKTDDVARDRSKHAFDILKKAKIMTLKNVRKEYATLIATTCRVGTDYNIPRSPATPKQMAELIKPHIKNKKTKIGIVLGRESKGLSNEEVGVCDFSVTIPTDKKYPAMNISHAATVLMYEIALAREEDNIASFVIPSTAKDKEVFLDKVDEVIKKMPFTAESKRVTQRVVWKKLIGKSFLTKRELFALHGFLRKIK